MSPADAVRSVYRNYANFSGRASRSEFWWFLGFLFLSYLGVAFLAGALRIYSVLAVIGLVWLVSLIPYLAVMIRRLHDTDRSGWWLLITFIPFGGLVLLAFLASGSSPYPNRFGPPPNQYGVYSYGTAQDWSQNQPRGQWGVNPNAGPQDWTHPLSRNAGPPSEEER